MVLHVGVLPEDWSDFLVAASGASAALAGLVFVGISINLTRILALPGLPGRAGQTIVVLANALALSLAVLGPQHSHVGVGVEILVLGLVGWLAGHVDPRPRQRSTPPAAATGAARG